MYPLKIVSNPLSRLGDRVEDSGAPINGASTRDKRLSNRGSHVSPLSPSWDRNKAWIKYRVQIEDALLS